MDSSKAAQTIGEPKWPNNPPWPFVAELEKRVGRLEEKNAELLSLVKDLLAALSEQEGDNADE